MRKAFAHVAGQVYKVTAYHKKAIECAACHAVRIGKFMPGFGKDAKLEGETIQRRRKAAAEIVRSHDISKPITVIFRPLKTCREPPLDPLAKSLLTGTDAFVKSLKKKGKYQVATMRDELLLRLWDALFLTACEHWSEPDRLDKGKEHWVTNTTLKDTQEFAWWF